MKSIKSVSAADIEAAIAAALKTLTGREHCDVTVHAMEFGPENGSSQLVKLKLDAWLHNGPLDLSDLPF